MQHGEEGIELSTIHTHSGHGAGVSKVKAHHTGWMLAAGNRSASMWLDQILLHTKPHYTSMFACSINVCGLLFVSESHAAVLETSVKT